MDDDGCDGISWWAYQYYTPNPGNGTLRFTKLGIPISLKTFNGDFGCQITERFMTSSSITSIDKIDSKSNFQLFPNPTTASINIVCDVKEFQNLDYIITDITGKEVKTGQLTAIGSEVYPINIEDLTSGMYFFTGKFEKAGVITQKFIINK
jgi:hypothetical protein